MTLQEQDATASLAQHPLRRAPMQRRSVERVQRMLDAAQELVGDQGYDALTTTLIAERADVSIGSLYQFFPDKQAVVRAVALRNLEHFSDRLSALVSTGEFLDWWDLVSAVIDEFVEMHHQKPGFSIIGFGDVADMYLLDPVRDNDTVVADRFLELLAPLTGQEHTEALRMDMVIAVKISDALTRYAFDRDPGGDVAVLAETKRIVRTHLTRTFGEPVAR